MQMLNRNSKRFIKFLKNSTPDFDNRVFTYDFIDENYTQPIEQVYATIRFLKENDFLETATINGTPVGIILTERALYYMDFISIDLKVFFLKSICTPILVSFVTTLITLWLKQQL